MIAIFIVSFNCLTDDQVFSATWNVNPLSLSFLIRQHLNTISRFPARSFFCPIGILYDIIVNPKNRALNDMCSKPNVVYQSNCAEKVRYDLLFFLPFYYQKMSIQ